MKKIDSKKCIYCNKEFFKTDFPRSFNRMITCGNIECAGERRKELWSQRYEGLKSLHSDDI